LEKLPEKDKRERDGKGRERLWITQVSPLERKGRRIEHEESQTSTQF
jgi:hypothetical protein